MKAFDFIQNVKKRDHRQAILIAAGVLAYLVVVSWPQVLRVLCDLWSDMRAFGIEDNSVWTCMFSFGSTVFVLLCLLAGLAIWVLSIIVTWAAFRKSRKKAYLFILAYFLMPLAVEPATRLSRHIANETGQYRGQLTASNLEIAQARPVAPSAYVVKKSINLPVGPFLLLAGVWYLYRKETTTDGEHAGGG